MAEGIRRDRGGILGLRRLLTEHGEAIEYELIAVGERLRWLGTDRLTWRDLLVVVKHAPPQGALHRSVDPDGAGWTVEAYLTAALVDATNAANWQRAGDKHAKRPDPIPRPGQPRKPVKRGRNLTQMALAQRNGGTADGR